MARRLFACNVCGESCALAKDGQAPTSCARNCSGHCPEERWLELPYPQAGTGGVTCYPHHPGYRLYPIDALHKAFHDAVVACALAREGLPGNGLDPSLVEDLEQTAKDAEKWIAEVKAGQLKAALGIPAEEW